MAIQFVYYIAEINLKRLHHHDFAQKVRGFINKRRIPATFVQLIQKSQGRKIGMRGSTFGIIDDYLLDSYVFFKFRKDLTEPVIIEHLKKIEKGLNGIIRLLKFNDTFQMIPYRDYKKLKNLTRRTTYIRKYVKQALKVNDYVEILKGRYMGHFGYIIKDPDGFSVAKNIKTVWLSDTTTIHIPESYLEKH